MDQSERYFLQKFEKSLCEQVDPLKITQKLCSLRVLNDSKKQYIFSLSNRSRQVIWKHLFPLLEEHCGLQQVLKVLLGCGYIEVFLQIAIQWRCSNSVGKDVVAVQRSGSMDSSRRFSQDLFIELKIKTHNINLGNPREALRYQSELYKADYLSEVDGIGKMAKADKYAASLCAEIDAHTMLYVQKFPSHGLFDELKQLITGTSNTHVTQVAYDSRLAIAHAIAKHDNEGEEFLRSAMSFSIYIGHCVELVNMLYIYVFNLLCVYEKTPSKRLLDKIMNIAEFSLQCLQEEENDIIRYFWMRMFYLRMIYCLLGISNKGDIIPGCIVLRKHVQTAEDLLIEVDKIWNGIESRRQMFYFVAKARIAELENTPEEIDLAEAYINMAIEIGSKGNFGETEFIKAYANVIKGKNHRKDTDGENQDTQTSKAGFDNSYRTAVEHDENTDYQNCDTPVKQLYIEKDIKNKDTKMQISNETCPKSTLFQITKVHQKHDKPCFNESVKHSDKSHNTKTNHQSDEIDKICNETFESLFISNDGLKSYPGGNSTSFIHLHRPDSAR